MFTGQIKSAAFFLPDLFHVTFFYSTFYQVWMNIFFESALRPTNATNSLPSGLQGKRPEICSVATGPKLLTA